MKNIPAEPFFLDASPGKRFCLYHSPAGHPSETTAFLYIHPFAEEMNKSRRMAALQSKAFATMGFGVLQIDLYGCGDSEGDFGEATWEIWKKDIACARQWLIRQGYISIHFWGLRLGALLALDYAREKEGEDAVKFVLWQPVISGKSFLTQFLRLRLANKIMTDNQDNSLSVQALREILETGEPIEIAGYTLAPAIAAAIDNLKLSGLAVRNNGIYWFEIVAEAGRRLSPAGVSVLNAWNQAGIDPEVVLIPGLPFWATQEISECSDLLAATVRPFAGIHL